jgi:hypothetical protein
VPPFNYENNEMTIASDLLQQHIRTLVDDNGRLQTLISDDISWELAYGLRLAIRRNWRDGRKRSVTQTWRSLPFASRNASRSSHTLSSRLKR